MRFSACSINCWVRRIWSECLVFTSLQGTAPCLGSPADATSRSVGWPAGTTWFSPITEKGRGMRRRQPLPDHCMRAAVLVRGPADSRRPTTPTADGGPCVGGGPHSRGPRRGVRPALRDRASATPMHTVRVEPGRSPVGAGVVSPPRAVASPLPSGRGPRDVRHSTSRPRAVGGRGARVFRLQR